MDTKERNRVTAGHRRPTKRPAVSTADRRRPSRRRPAAPEAKAKPRAALRNKTLRRASAAPRVVYTPARPISRGRLLLRLTTVVAVVLALSLGLSIFFKVEVITVSGAQKYDPWTIKEASGIQVGDNLLSFGEAKAAGKIRTALPYVYSVRIGIKLPDTVNIEIKELDVVYAIRDAANQWWLISASGRVVEKADSAKAGECTQILGVQISNPAAGEQAVAYEPPQDATDENGQTVPVTVTGSQRLETALQILQHMEDNGIIGEAATVDVESLGNIELWYGQRFQVLLGDTQRLDYKIRCMNGVINGKDEQNSLKEYDSGVLDITFSIKENQVIYQAFE